MEAMEYLKLATDKTEVGDLIKENNLTEAVIKLMSNYAEFRVKNCSIPAVVGQSEQLTCPRCNSTNILSPDKDNDAQCIECAFIWAG